MNLPYFLNIYMTILSLTNKKVRSSLVRGRKSSVSVLTDNKTNLI